LLPPQGAWQKQGWEQLTHMMPTSRASATLAHLCTTMQCQPCQLFYNDEFQQQEELLSSQTGLYCQQPSLLPRGSVKHKTLDVQ